MRNRWPFWVFFALLSLIVLAFFCVSRCGFFKGDDLAMGYGGFSSLKDVWDHTKWFYLNLGGRYFTVASQYFFSGLIGKKIWFDVVNTVFFLLLILACGKMVATQENQWIHGTVLFALFFWFLCPVPSESLFWMAGATTHLWANSLAFVYLCLFLLYKDGDASLSGKIGLFCISLVSAAEFIPCAAICGALVVYYAFHLKSFRGNAVPLAMGFVIGSMLVLFAPGNFLRASEELAPLGERIGYSLTHPIQEVVKYKALWLFLLVMAWGCVSNWTATKAWLKDHLFLLLSLGWGIIAFSFVFKPANRASFFPETLSLVLFLKFLSDNYRILGIRGKEGLISRHWAGIGTIVLVLLSMAFVFDAGAAMVETSKQKRNNDAMMEKLAESGGITALDQLVPSHRMAYAERFPEWTWEPLADQFGLDSVHVYPYYCQDKYYLGRSPGLEDTYVEEIRVDDDSFGKMVRLIVRVKEDVFMEGLGHVSFTIDYRRPVKWYKSWLDKLRGYQYDRSITVERDRPDVLFDGYGYYEIWMKRENAAGLKRVTYSFL